MRILTKFCVVAATVAISTSLAYADTLGIGQMSLGNGVDSNTTTSLTIIQPPNSTVSILGATGSLSGFAGDMVNFDTLDLSTGMSITGQELFNVADAAGDELMFDLGSISFSEFDNDLHVDITGTYSEVLANNGGTLTATPGSINLTTQESPTNGGSPDVTFSATTSVTPEPSSLLLLGTGLLGAAGIARRKFASKFV